MNLISRYRGSNTQKYAIKIFFCDPKILSELKTNLLRDWDSFKELISFNKYFFIHIFFYTHEIENRTTNYMIKKQNYL